MKTNANTYTITLQAAEAELLHLARTCNYRVGKGLAPAPAALARIAALRAEVAALKRGGSVTTRA